MPLMFIARHGVPVVKKEKSFQDPFAGILCYTMMLGERVPPLVASMYVLGHIATLTAPGELITGGCPPPWGSIR
jgi:hypothetical protein